MNSENTSDKNQVKALNKTDVMRGFKTELKRLIKNEYKLNRKSYDDIDEVMVRIVDNKITFYDGNAWQINQLD